MLQRGEGLLQALHKAFQQIYFLNYVSNKSIEHLKEFTRKSSVDKKNIYTHILSVQYSMGELLLRKRQSSRVLFDTPFT